jgi:hypothetical protein
MREEEGKAVLEPSRKWFCLFTRKDFEKRSATLVNGIQKLMDSDLK